MIKITSCNLLDNHMAMTILWLQWSLPVTSFSIATNLSITTKGSITDASIYASKAPPNKDHSKWILNVWVVVIGRECCSEVERSHIHTNASWLSSTCLHRLVAFQTNCDSLTNHSISFELLKKYPILVYPCFFVLHWRSLLRPFDVWETNVPFKKMLFCANTRQ